MLNKNTTALLAMRLEGEMQEALETFKDECKKVKNYEFIITDTEQVLTDNNKRMWNRNSTKLSFEESINEMISCIITLETRISDTPFYFIE